MSVLVRENILASKGNQAVFGANQDVFNSDGSTNVSPGQLVVWDPITKRSLGPTVTPATHDRIVVSVGVDRFTLRSGFGNEMFGNNIFAATAEPSGCGTAPVYDILFNCAEADEEYTITISVKDEDSINQYPYNKMPTYSYTVNVQDFACSGCTGGIDTHALSCAFRDAINEKRGSILKSSTFLPSRNRTGSKKFTAHILYGGDNPDSSTNATTKVFCINAVTDACSVNCIHAGTAIKTLQVAVGDEHVLNFSVDPADETKTLLSQLEGIVSQINTILAGKGSAVLTKGFGACCPYRLEINSCYVDLELWDDEDVKIEPCEEFNPFDPDYSPVTVDNTCQNCADEATTTLTFTSGLRIVGAPIDYTCSTNPDVNPMWMKHRELQVNAVKGFKPRSVYVRQIEKGSSPKNLAYDWIVRDYLSDNGGPGRNHDAFEHRGYGAAGYPLEKGRIGGISKNLACSASVCSYVFEHGLPHMDGSIYGKPANALGRTVVVIPSGDTVTRADFEAIMNNYITNSKNIVKKTITCASDNDQTEGASRYPDSNGYIL